MDVRFVEWRGELYIVLGIGYDSRIDPPDVFVAVPFDGKQTPLRAVISAPGMVKIPFVEAIEITDEKRIQAILVLFGGRNG